MKRDELVGRASAWFAIAWPHLVAAVASAAGAFAVLRFAADAPAASLERDISLVVAGGLLSAAGGAAYRLVTTLEAYRQGAYTERARAVQDVLAIAREAKSLAVTAFEGPGLGVRYRGTEWSAEGGRAKASEDLMGLAWHHRVWIGKKGDTAVRAFLSATRSSHLRRDGVTKADVEKEVTAAFDVLERALMRGLGYWPS